MVRNLYAYVVLFVWLWCGLSAAADNEYYDEVFDEQGNVRPQYVEVYAAWTELTDEEKRDFERNSYGDFLRDNSLASLPRIITESERSTIAKGIEQRARALQMFLEDHFSEQRYLKEKIIPEFVMERILKRTRTDSFQGQIDPRKVDLNFFYGPDVIRDRNGEWRIYEDNTTFVGGFGDLIKAREILQNRAPSVVGAAHVLDDPRAFYENLAKSYKERASEYGGKVVLVSLTLTQQADNEERRLRRIFEELGIEYVTTGTDRSLVVEEDGVYLKRPGGGREKVGYVILAAEHGDIDFSRPDFYQKNIVEYAKEHLQLYEMMNGPKDGLKGEDLKWWNYGQTFSLEERQRVIARLKDALRPREQTGKPNFDLLELIMTYETLVIMEPKDMLRSSIPGLTDAVLAGKVGCNNTPGIDMIDDKEFYTYVEDLIRFYLKEEPFIKNVPTTNFALINEQGKPELDRTVLQRILENQKDFVIKGVGGRGGDSVYILRKKTRTEINKLLSAIEAAPQDYIAQQYSPPSRQLDVIGDYRPLSQVLRQTFVISPTYWLRGSSITGSGLVNLSGKDGFEVAALVVPDPPVDCKIPLAKYAGSRTYFPQVLQ